MHSGLDIKLYLYRYELCEIKDMLLLGDSTDSSSTSEEEDLEFLFLDVLFAPKRHRGPQVNLQAISDLECKQLSSNFIPIYWLCRANTDYFFGQGNVVPSLGPSESGHIVLGNDVERAFIVTNQQKNYFYLHLERANFLLQFYLNLRLRQARTFPRYYLTRLRLPNLLNVRFAAIL